MSKAQIRWEDDHLSYLRTHDDLITVVILDRIKDQLATFIVLIDVGDARDMPVRRGVDEPTACVIIRIISMSEEVPFLTLVILEELKRFAKLSFACES